MSDDAETAERDKYPEQREDSRSHCRLFEIDVRLHGAKMVDARG